MKIEYNLVTGKFDFPEDMTPDDYVLLFKNIVSGNLLLSFMNQIDEKFKGTDTLKLLHQKKAEYLTSITKNDIKPSIITGETSWNNLQGS